MMLAADLEIAPDAIAPPPIGAWMRSVTIIHPAHGEVLFEPYPYQDTFWEDRSPSRLVLKARQVGMSQAWALEALYYSIFYRNQRTLFVSKTEDDARNLLAYARQAYDSLTDKPALLRDNTSDMLLANGSRIRSLPATKSAGRGFTANRVYLDEFAFADYGREIYRAVRPTLSRGGQLTAGSTANGQDNLFYELWSEQTSGAWSRHLIHWRDCPEYDADWFARERPQYTAQDWASEYECDLAGSGQAVFDRDAIAACALGWRGLQAPQPNRRYVTHWDVGIKRDATVGVTLDVTDPDDWQIVAFSHAYGLLSPLIQDHIAERARAYHLGRRGCSTAVESNGLGDPIIQNLEVPVTPFFVTAKSKVQAIKALLLAIERGRLHFDIPQLAGELRRYQWDDSKLVQDCVMAVAGAALTATQLQRGTVRVRSGGKRR